MRTLVPVSVRSSTEHGVYNNRVSAMFADLPVGIEDPVERLHSIRAQMADLKESHEAVAGEVLTSLGGFAPPLLLALAERLATRVPQHNVNTVTTNVPGPQHPLYACGRRMLESLPYVPLGGHVRVGVAIYSYDGACTFGVTGDYDAAPDIDVLCEGIERSLAELLGRARSRRSARAPRGANGSRQSPLNPRVAAADRLSAPATGDDPNMSGSSSSAPRARPRAVRPGAPAAPAPPARRLPRRARRDADATGPHPGQRWMASRALPQIYERLWRPLGDAC